MEAIKLSVILNATPEEVYNAWLSSASHTAFTGSPAVVSETIGKSFTAWDDYISGTNLELEPGKRILQSWRTTEFDPKDPDSKLELDLSVHPEGCLLMLRHWDIPDGQGKGYADGWEEFYFEPMKAWFSK